MQQRIAAYVRDEAARRKLPAVAYAVVQGEQVVATGGVGATKRGGGAPVTADTLFQVGSVTKSMTATAIMQLKEQGLVDLDAPVQRYLPWFTLADAEAASRLTVRHLLNQVSGFGNGAWKVGLDPANRTSLEQSVRAVKALKPLTPPGSKWQYSNMNYNILGLIVQTVSGLPYADYMTDAIFRPLGMERSCFTIAEAERFGHAQGYGKEFGRLKALPAMDDAWCAPSGLALFTTANDMARFARAALRQGPAQVLAPETWAEAQSDGVKTGAGNLRYALGWMTADFHGSPIVFHAGTTAAHQSMLALLPDEQIGVVVLANTGAQESEAIALSILRLIKGLAPEGKPYLPNIGGVVGSVLWALTAVGAAIIVALAAWAAAGWGLGWAGTVIWAVVALFLATMPGAMKRSQAAPAPVPLPVGCGGWGAPLVVAYWALEVGAAAWAVYGLVSLLG